jgi:hypothetical protein
LGVVRVTGRFIAWSTVWTGDEAVALDRLEVYMKVRACFGIRGSLSSVKLLVAHIRRSDLNGPSPRESLNERAVNLGWYRKRTYIRSQRMWSLPSFSRRIYRH